MLQARLISNLLNQGLKPYLTPNPLTTASSSPGSKSSKSTFASRSNSNNNGNTTNTNCRSINGSTLITPESNAPLSISLLNGDGLPLATVFNEDVVSSIHSHTDLKDQVHQMYPLIVRNAIGLNFDSTWRKVSLTDDICAMIALLETNRPGGLFLIIIYHTKMPDLIAKIKLDELQNALNKGLKGY